MLRPLVAFARSPTAVDATYAKTIEKIITFITLRLKDVSFEDHFRGIAELTESTIEVERNDAACTVWRLFVEELQHWLEPPTTIAASTAAAASSSASTAANARAANSASALSSVQSGEDQLRANLNTRIGKITADYLKLKGSKLKKQDLQGIADRTTCIVNGDEARIKCAGEDCILCRTGKGMKCASVTDVSNWIHNHLLTMQRPSATRSSGNSSSSSSGSVITLDFPDSSDAMTRTADAEETDEEPSPEQGPDAKKQKTSSVQRHEGPLLLRVRVKHHFYALIICLVCFFSSRLLLVRSQYFMDL